MELSTYLASKLNIVLTSSSQKDLLEEIKKRDDAKRIWREILIYYFLENHSIPSAFRCYFFWDKRGAAEVLAFFEEQCGSDTVSSDLKILEQFILRLRAEKVQSQFLGSISNWFEEILHNNHEFYDYGRILKYSILLTWHLETHKLSNSYFDNFFFVLRMAGEQDQRGFSYKGRIILQNFAQYMPNHLLGYIVTRKNLSLNNEDEAVSGYRVSDNGIYWLIEYSSLSTEKKKRYKFITKYFYELHIGLQKAVEARVLKEWFHYDIIYADVDLKKGNDIFRILQNSEGDRITLRYEKSVVDLWWRFRLLRGTLCIWEWRMCYGTEPVRDDFVLQTTEWGNGIDSREEKVTYSFEVRSRELLHQISDGMDIRHYVGAEVVGIWHESLYQGKIPERCLSFTSDIDVKRLDESEQIKYEFDFKKSGMGRYKRFFYLDRRAYGNISSISAVVGKNGSGKTSAFRLLCQDGPHLPGPFDNSRYVIFYYMRDSYYYSTNIPDCELRIIGLDRKYNLTQDMSKKAVIVYFTNVLSLYRQEDEQENKNFIDLSNNGIWNREVAQIDAGEKYKDILRRLRLLDDLNREFGKDERKIKELQQEFRINTVHVRIPAAITGMVQEEIENIRKMTQEEYYKDNAAFDQEIRICGIEEINPVYKLCVAALKAALKYKKESSEKILDLHIFIPNLSSGQQAKLEMYGRLHSLFLAKREMENPNDDILKVNYYEGVASDNYILLLDEIESYLHPEWQRCFVYELIRFLEWENKKRVYENIQIVLSSNSPFFMSDLPSDNICALYRSDKEAPGDRVKIEELLEKGTFAQNIHRIMKSSFFMDEGLMGKFAKQKLDWAFDSLKRDSLNESDKEEIRFIMNQTGEPLLKRALIDLYMDKYPPKTWDEKKKQVSDILKDLSGEQRTRLLEEVKKKEFS